jgi:hypothetical protein
MNIVSSSKLGHHSLFFRAPVRGKEVAKDCFLLLVSCKQLNGNTVSTKGTQQDLSNNMGIYLPNSQRSCIWLCSKEG